MGARFKHESYDWDQDGKLVNQSAQFLQHMLKNEVVKIEWCAQNIQQSAPGGSSGLCRHHPAVDHALEGAVRQSAPLFQRHRPEPAGAANSPAFGGLCSGLPEASPGVQVEVRCGERGTNCSVTGRI